MYEVSKAIALIKENIDTVPAHGCKREEVLALLEGEYDNKVSHAMLEEFHSAVELFDRKHSDYGKNNISISGQIGIVVRMFDKLARIQNLLNKEGEPNEESLEDSWVDLMNYAGIGKLLGNGKWDELA